jgi:hypothetical protein
VRQLQRSRPPRDANLVVGSATRRRKVPLLARPDVQTRVEAAQEGARQAVQAAREAIARSRRALDEADAARDRALAKRDRESR